MTCGLPTHLAPCHFLRQGSDCWESCVMGIRHMHSVSLAGVLHGTHMKQCTSANLRCSSRSKPMPQTQRHNSRNGVSCRVPAPRRHMPPRCPLPRQSYSRSDSCILSLLTASVTAPDCGHAAKEAGVRGSRREAAVGAVSDLPAWATMTRRRAGRRAKSKRPTTGRRPQVWPHIN